MKSKSSAHPATLGTIQIKCILKAISALKICSLLKLAQSANYARKILKPPSCQGLNHLLTLAKVDGLNNAPLVYHALAFSTIQSNEFPKTSTTS